MKTSKRLELAVQKLYIAFHNNTLYPECCKQCAVGNILDHTDSWKYLSDHHGSIELNYIGRVHQTLGRKFNGYSPQELLKIEHVFLKACGFLVPLHYKNDKPKNALNKDQLFNGLCEVIELLCQFDGIKNVMSHKNIIRHKRQPENLVLVS
ncbi:Na(+)-translocating NADH-quinone reductase subunit F [uncultured Algibacter sp.]|uniref:Na(+)-translocating NADH-quinone reductase subunit F n=1 Tax=uncultured Algibacter sp. TaxID=298659 RepID=UPI002627FBB0|nr:Na(+)-translocating NADH-quinone reductase subunit F [uncultured Algibacter sp.]